ncbi:hypothetical protein HDU98_003518 [Podochytrium sp. JEL0797]|nr:hypothetical protein HDU98_003518 [Podochytrium sp. JEL0797]
MVPFQFECPLGCTLEGDAASNLRCEMEDHLSEYHKITRPDYLNKLVHFAYMFPTLKKPAVVLYRCESEERPAIAPMETGIEDKVDEVDMKDTWSYSGPTAIHHVLVAYSYTWRKRYRDPSREPEKHTKITEQEMKDCYDEFVLAIEK